jgi:hypothetical protein
MCKCHFLIIKSQCFLIFKQVYFVLLQEVGEEGLRAMDQAISPLTLEAWSLNRNLSMPDL